MMNLNIDIFIITETFLRSTIPSSFIAINGYDIFRRDRTVCNCKQSNCIKDHKGGGILIYARSNLNCTTYETHPELESLWIKGSSPNADNNFFINASYNPPKNYKNNSPLTAYLTSSTLKIIGTYAHNAIFIGGDFNKLNLSSLEDDGICILQTPPTRKDATFDLLLTNRPDLVESATTFIPTLSTDHLGIIMHPTRKIPPIRTKTAFKDYSKKNKNIFSTMMHTQDFSEIKQISDPNLAASTLDNILCHLVAQAFPIKTVTMSDRDPTWITPRTKAQLLKMKKIKQRKGITKRTNTLYTNIGKQKINRLGSKDWWHEIDNISHRKHEKKKLSSSSFDGASLNKALAERSRLTDPTDRPAPPTFHVTPAHAPQMSILDVEQALRNCKPTSPGPIDIPTFVFKEYWYILAPIYHFVWNLSLSTAVFPTCYKRAKLTAIPKINNASSTNDIRGISVTPTSARIFERIVHKLWILPSICTIGDPLQFAYKPTQSTADCLITLQHKVLSLLDKPTNDGVHCITVDFSKAFDRLDQHIAATKYSTFISSSNLQKWLFDFSTNRSQGLFFNNVQLPQLSIHTGCSQGTVGGPNIFTMFTDDLRARNTSSSIIKYSDDSTLITPCIRRPTDIETQTLHQEINHINNWSEKNNLDINTSKTKHIRFCLNKRPSCSCNIPNDFETVTQVTILGITFEQDCSFRKHRKRLISHLRSLLYIIRDIKLSRKTDKEIDTIFNALIISKIRYGISTYGSDSKTIDKISKFLHRCHEKGYSPKKYCAHQILEEEDQRLLHNILRNPRHPLHNYLTTQKKPRQTRQSFSTTRPYTNTLAFHRTFCNRVLPY